jgi:hypothetical protein
VRLPGEGAWNAGSWLTLGRLGGAQVIAGSSHDLRACLLEQVAAIVVWKLGGILGEQSLCLGYGQLQPLGCGQDSYLLVILPAAAGSEAGHLLSGLA